MFRTIAINFLLSAFLPAMFACGKAPDPVKPDPVRTEQGGEQEDKNDTALREAPITYEAHNYDGFEKVGRWDGLCPPATRAVRISRRTEVFPEGRRGRHFRHSVAVGKPGGLRIRHVEVRPVLRSEELLRHGWLWREGKIARALSSVKTRDE